MAYPHILIVCYPAQGHLNPSLQLAQMLIEIGVQVTIATSKFAHHHITKASCSASQNFNFVPILDGYADNFKPHSFDVNHLNALQEFGLKILENVVETSAEKGHRVTCIVYTILLTWAAKVAREKNIPTALLWIQAATVLGIYYNYFHGYEDEIKNQSDKPNWSIQWPGLPLLSRMDFPSFLLPSSSSTSNIALQKFKEQFNVLDEEKDSYVLVNTSDALEHIALKCIEKYKNIIGIGPLIPYPALEKADPNTILNRDVSQEMKNNYLEWLTSKPTGSVIYIAFGSITMPSKQQMEELARGLVDCGRPFLWVIREIEVVKEENLGCIKQLEEKGKIIPWSSQIEVLKHPSVGCFLTHCGWNSTLESIVLGVPVIAFPQWTDQWTNAKLFEDIWRMGVKVIPNHNGIVDRTEIKRCIEVVMNSEHYGLELRNNAKKWKKLVTNAMKEDGSSINNVKEFVYSA